MLVRLPAFPVLNCVPFFAVMVLPPRGFGVTLEPAGGLNFVTAGLAAAPPGLVAPGAAPGRLPPIAGFAPPPGVAPGRLPPTAGFAPPPGVTPGRLPPTAGFAPPP